MARTLRLSQVREHNSERSCWMAIHGKVYDITAFIQKHPGGRGILLQNAGKDASAAFDSAHPPEILREQLTPEQCLGDLDPLDISHDRPHLPPSQQAAQESMPPLSCMLSLLEIESYAMKCLSPKAISYYVSASDDEITKAENTRIYRSILLRPRVFKDCTTCTLRTTLIDQPVNLPIFISPAARARLAHPSGEAGIASACARFNALQIISANASMSPADIVRAGGPGAVFAWQLYVLKDRAATERTLARIRTIPQIRFIVLTLDAPFPGKREADERFKMAEVAGGVAPQAWGTESALTWDRTLAWLRRHTSLPVVLKGIQTWEDALLATRFPVVKGIILSNHGGRALDTIATPVHILLEIRKYCPEIFSKLDVLVDGGIKRGTDVVKALALGAKGVGIGRPALYGLAVGGDKGMGRVLQSEHCLLSITASKL
ncbi:FMN-dependent dehydrogenase-domain-containing protein [Xylariaceae sp. FL0016]|nr:FMN-dependent dehydrogenase-domain-containing protein [Xylariaceae sp. FL0016]